MKQRYLTFISFFTLSFGIVILSCGNSTEEESTIQNTLFSTASNEQFNDYWYKGKAEIVTYELAQARYGEIHEGTAVQIFVTEPFNVTKQVKSDRQTDHDVNAFKMNLTRKFNTGIYPYSVMTSAFNTVNTNDPSEIIKVTNSSQEWCGHTWSQMNRSKKGFDYTLYSYFESESDISSELNSFMSEDGLWSQVRMNPSLLPQGNLEIIPGLHFLRFRHLPAKPYAAKAEIVTSDDYNTYVITYSEIRRTFKINYQPTFPFQIISWEEIYPSGFGSGADMVSTTGKAIHTELLPYWGLNSKSDSVYRKQIKLD